MYIKKEFFNRYSLALLVVFFCTTIVMQYHTYKVSLENFFFVLPLIGLAIFFSGKIVLLKKNDCHATIQDYEFQRDVFLISYSFLISSLISLLPEYNNSDARAWWGISVYYVSLIGVMYSCFFAYFNQFVRFHRVYTNIFTFIIIIAFLLSKLWPFYISILFLGEVSFFLIMMFSLVLLHLLCFSLYWLINFIHQAIKNRGGLLQPL